MRTKYIIGDFEGQFWGQKSRCPLETLREIAGFAIMQKRTSQTIRTSRTLA
jgi:hypothetical protein